LGSDRFARFSTRHVPLFPFAFLKFSYDVSEE